MSDRKTQKGCRVCSFPSLERVLDVGQQPLANRYLRTNPNREYKHRLALVQCRRCGVLQLRKPVPLHELRPRLPGLLYREPEGHLDQMTKLIQALPGVTKESAIWGLSYNDKTTLHRLQNKGYARIYAVDPQRDLGIRESRTGLETIQQQISRSALSGLIRRKGAADVLIARRLLDHAYEPKRLLLQLRRALRPGGHIIFEVPDCWRAIDAGDYTMIWEDHVLYFTPLTLKRALHTAGFTTETFRMFSYPRENALAIMVTAPSRKPEWKPVSKQELHAVRRYGSSFRKKRKELQRTLRRLQLRAGKLALLGAGHLSCHFINLMGVGKSIDYVLDGDPQKQGLLMPGSHLKIHSPAILSQAAIKYCLLGVSAESERLVLRHHDAFLKSGGQFLSIFPGVRNSAVPYLSKAWAQS